MNILGFKLTAILLLFIGEALSIYSEMIAARSNYNSSQHSLIIFSNSFFLIAMAGAFLITGYMLGYKSYKNIWIVSVMSITAILIVEPFLAYLLLKQLPTKGALVGLIFGCLGFIATTIL